MKFGLVLSGFLIGASLGLMIGGAMVEIKADGERKYPVFPSLLLAMVGVGSLQRIRSKEATSPTSA